MGDAALMLQAMAGSHPWDHTSLEAPPADYPARLDDGIAGLKVAFSPDLGHARVDADVAALVQSAAEAFQSLGCTVESPALPFGPEGPEIIRLLWPIHLHAYRPLLAEFEDRMDPGLVACIRAADGVTGATYLETRARKLAYVEAVHRFFEEWDLLLTPAVSVPAFPAERLHPEHWPSHPWDWIMWAEFSYPFNFSHNPAASVPCGFTDAGLPVGLQIVGKRFADLTVLQAARAFEQARTAGLPCRRHSRAVFDIINRDPARPGFCLRPRGAETGQERRPPIVDDDESHETGIRSATLLPDGAEITNRVVSTGYERE